MTLSYTDHGLAEIRKFKRPAVEIPVRVLRAECGLIFRTKSATDISNPARSVPWLTRPFCRLN